MRSVAKIVRFIYERMGGRDQFSGAKQILHVLDVGRIERFPMRWFWSSHA